METKQCKYVKNFLTWPKISSSKDLGPSCLIVWGHIKKIFFRKLSFHLSPILPHILNYKIMVFLKYSVRRVSSFPIQTFECFKKNSLWDKVFLPNLRRGKKVISFLQFKAIWHKLGHHPWADSDDIPMEHRKQTNTLREQKPELGLPLPAPLAGLINCTRSTETSSGHCCCSWRIEKTQN